MSSDWKIFYTIDHFQVESLYGQGSQHPSWQSPVSATLSSLPVTQTDSACVCVCVYINLYHVHVHTHGNSERLSRCDAFSFSSNWGPICINKASRHMWFWICLVSIAHNTFEIRTYCRLGLTSLAGWTLPILLNRCTWERPFPRDGQLCSLPAFHSYEPSCNKQPYLSTDVILCTFPCNQLQFS